MSSKLGYKTFSVIVDMNNLLADCEMNSQDFTELGDRDSVLSYESIDLAIFNVFL